MKTFDQVRVFKKMWEPRLLNAAADDAARFLVDHHGDLAAVIMVGDAAKGETRPYSGLELLAITAGTGAWSEAPAAGEATPEPPLPWTVMFPRGVPATISWVSAGDLMRRVRQPRDGQEVARWFVETGALAVGVPVHDPRGLLRALQRAAETALPDVRSRRFAALPDLTDDAFKALVPIVQARHADLRLTAALATAIERLLIIAAGERLSQQDLERLSVPAAYRSVFRHLDFLWAKGDAPSPGELLNTAEAAGSLAKTVFKALAAAGRLPSDGRHEEREQVLNLLPGDPPPAETSPLDKGTLDALFAADPDRLIAYAFGLQKHGRAAKVAPFMAITADIARWCDVAFAGCRPPASLATLISRATRKGAGDLMAWKRAASVGTSMAVDLARQRQKAAQSATASRMASPKAF